MSLIELIVDGYRLSNASMASLALLGVWASWRKEQR
jgi:hypothetical protein